MRTSVVMCTYNGERYVTEQMDSLKKQTCRIDEVLIFDDCSTDDTVQLVQDYIDKYELTGWKLIINAENKGHRLNFLDGIMRATGDILYYCDQDDIWLPQKVEKMNDAFKDTDVQVCECMEIRFDDNDKENYRLANQVYKGNGRLEKVDFFNKMKIPNGTGHTLAFTKEFRDKAVPVILKNDLAFDVPMADIASIFGGYYILGIPLMRHRVYTAGSGNTSNPHYSFSSRAKDINRQIASRRFKIGHVKCYREYFADEFSAKDKKVIDDFICFIDKRVEYMEERRLVRCFFQTFHYNKMNDLNFCLLDVLAIFFNRKNEQTKTAERG